MCPTVIAGTIQDLEDSPENIVLNFIKTRWNLERDGLIPSRKDITFSLYGFMGNKSYQISIEPSNSPPKIMNMGIGPDPMILRYLDPIVIHVWIRKLKDEVPPQLHHITQKVEQIVFENSTNVGYGITGIIMRTPFGQVEERRGSSSGAMNPTEISLYHTVATVELLYFKSITNIFHTARTFKTHLYDIEGVAEEE